MVLLVEDVTYEGQPLAVLVRAEAPWWHGEVRGFDPRAFVWLLDYRPDLDARPLTPGTSYRKGDAMLVDSHVYVCLQDHAFQNALLPRSEQGGAPWQLAIPRVVFRKNSIKYPAFA